MSFHFVVVLAGAWQLTSWLFSVIDLIERVRKT